LCVFATVAADSSLDSENSNPMASVIGMLQDLKAKIEHDADAENKAYTEFYQWCDRVTGQELHAIKLDEKALKELKAKIEKYFAEIEQSGQQISEEAKAIAASISDAKGAKDLREKQFADFKVAEKDLVESIDMITRAISVLEHEMEKGSSSSASFMQRINQNMPSLIQTLGLIADAASFSTADKSKLLGLVQAQQSTDDDTSAPAGSAYESRSGSIIDMLGDMKDKAETQLSELRTNEMQARYTFKELRAALKAQQEADKKDQAEAKTTKAKAEEDEATAEKEKNEVDKVLSVETEAYTKTKAQCMQTSSDHEAGVKSRTEELKVVGEAIDILQSMTSGAVAQTYNFLQVGSAQKIQLHSTNEVAHYQVVALVSHLANLHKSAQLAQLASRINAVIRYGAVNGEDPFAKVKGLIQDLITQLEKESASDSTEQAYCKEQMAETSGKQSTLDDQIKSLTAEIDQSSARSAKLKDDVKALQKDLAILAQEQADLNKIRRDENDAYLVAKADLEKGIEGVRKALTVLRDYYAKKDEAESEDAPDGVAMLEQPSPPDVSHKKSGSAASGIIDILEMAESDFASSLAKLRSEESNAQSQYEKATQENEVQRASVDQEVKFKSKEFKSLDKKITQLQSDRESGATEQAAVLDYAANIKSRCVAKPSNYEERKKLREAEIRGLKEAMAILKNEAAFMQHEQLGSRLRGSRQAD